MKTTILNLLTRKMIMFYLSLVTVWSLTWFGKLTGDNFMLAFGLMISAFVAGNVWAKKFPNNNLKEIIEPKQ